MGDDWSLNQLDKAIKTLGEIRKERKNQEEVIEKMLREKKQESAFIKLKKEKDAGDLKSNLVNELAQFFIKNNKGVKRIDPEKSPILNDINQITTNVKTILKRNQETKEFLDGLEKRIKLI